MNREVQDSPKVPGKGRWAVLCWSSVVLILVGWVLIYAFAGSTGSFLGSEPVHQGATLSQWLSKLIPGGLTTGMTNVSVQFGAKGTVLREGNMTWLLQISSQTQTETEAAIRAIGEAAIPQLVSMLATHDSRLRNLLATILSKQSLMRIAIEPATILNHRALLAFQILGGAANPALPALKRLAEDTSCGELAFRALDAIGTSQSKATIRAVLATGNKSTLRNAASALGLWLPDSSKPPFEALQAVLAGSDTNNHRSALMAIAKIGEPAEQVVPLIVAFLGTNHDGSTRSAALEAIALFGVDAKSFAPAIRQAIGENPGPLQFDLDQTLRKIEGTPPP